MIRSDLIKFESCIKSADSIYSFSRRYQQFLLSQIRGEIKVIVLYCIVLVPLIGRKCTYTRKLSHLIMNGSIYNLFNITSSYLHVAVSKERAAVLKLLNRSNKSNITLRRLLVMSCLHSVFRDFLIRGFSFPISLKTKM